MLCGICTNIFEGGPQAREYRLETVGVEHGRTIRYIHHATTASLVTSASLHCYICVRVWKDALSHGFSRGPEVRWQRHCSTSYVLQTLDRYTLSISSLELLISYVRKRRISDGPGTDDIIFWTRFILEPANSVSPAEDFETAAKIQDIQESTNSEAAWNVALKWISDCSICHQDCIQSGSPGKQFPTRLIKVGEAGSSLVQLYESNYFFHETNDLLHPVGERYVTLSHCWGKAQILRLTKSSYEKLKSGVSDTELPKTFQDAVYITRRLGINYIWIDSLCIFQDSTEDWLKESSAMTRIYRQAYCNISALDSSNSSKGCFRDRNPRWVNPCIITANWVGLPQGNFNIYYKDLWQSEVAAAPLHKRAWVVQERLLAPRVLHFGREQLFWECHTMNACETYPAGLPPCLSLSDMSINFKGLSPSVYGENLRKMSNWDCSDSSLNQLYVWEKVVRTYTSCALSKEQDKLIAISGIAKRVQPLSLTESAIGDGKLAGYRPAKYLAGLWDFFLPAQLLWEVKSGSRPSSYRAPSWSWASLDGQVSFRDAFNDGEDHVKIFDCTTSYVSEDPFGQVNDGRIHLEGYPVLLGSNITSTEDGYILTANGHKIGIICRPDVTDERPNGALYCLPIRTYRTTTENSSSQRLGCLILTPTYKTRGEFYRWAQITLENTIDKRAIQEARSVDQGDFSNLKTANGKYNMTII